MTIPQGATHVSFKGAWTKVDFVLGTANMEESPSVNLQIDGATSVVQMVIPNAPAGAGTDIYLLMIEFFQEVNGIQYSLKNGAFNVLSAIDVV